MSKCPCCCSFSPPSSGRRAVVTALGAACGLFFLGAGAQDARATESSFKLIVHPDNRAARATRKFLTDAFLKRLTEWDDGHLIEPVDRQRTAAVRHDFSTQVLGRSVAAVRHFWQQRIFSGRGVPPPELPSDEAVVEYVLQHRGAVGYVTASAKIGAARVLRIG
jgi:hypothetical protein